MNYCGVTVLLGLLCCSFFMSSNAHPFSTFGMQILNVTADGVSNPPEIVSGKQYRIYFHFVDNLHNYAPVTMKNVIKYHQKYFHILVVSQDQEVTLHIHPDDQMDLENAPLDLSLFYLDITFPRGGTYSLAASFLFFDSILDRHREGFAQTELGPFTGDTGKPTYDYSTNGRYPTYAFDSNGNFDSWIDTKTNVDDNQGYYATFEIFGRNDSDVNAGLNYIHSNVCTWFKLTIHKNDSMNTPATMLPYLAASVHLTVALDDGGVYHAHGMYLQSEDQTFDQLVATQKGMTMARMMKLKTSDPMYNLSMNAAMIGITNTGGYNCSSDEGDVTDYMMDMMDMSMFYGPSSFGSVVGIFDFAAPGVSDWRIFAYMKVQLSNGEERLIVPHFSVRSFGANLPTTPPDNSTDALSSESRSDAFTIAPVQFFIFALVCVISLF